MDWYTVPQGRSVTVAAPAKLNLSLRVVGRRGDGYHLLDSIAVPIRIFDSVRIRAVPQVAAESEISLSCNPAAAAPAAGSNLVWRAASLYCQRTGFVARLAVDLVKRIPVGAGLGGGSSDAAATLRGLNAISPAPIRADLLSSWALDLGADVPFFMYGRPARMRGIGEELAAAQSPLPEPSGLAVVFPGAGLSTAEVYGRFDDSLTRNGGLSTIRALTVPRRPLSEFLHNDLEAAATQALPILQDLKRDLRALGARVVRMTGSGSAMFGVWSRVDDARAAAAAMRGRGLWARATEVLERVPAVVMDDAR